MSYTLPAAGGILAYLNAKYHLSADVWGVSTAIAFQAYTSKVEKNDRVNSFYRFEEFAKNPKFANRVFLVVPQNEEQPNARTEWTYAEAYDVVL